MEDSLIDVAEQAVDMINQEFENNVPEELVGNMEYLYTSARIFYDKIAEVWTRIENINYMERQQHKLKELIKAEKETEASKVQQELQNYQRAIVSKEEFSQFMTNVFQFQEVVNAVLGQKVQMVYVYVDRKGNPTLYKIDNTGDHLKQSLASKGGGMTARYGSLRQSFLESHGEKILNSLKNNGQEQLDLAYKETVRRGKYSRQKLQIGFLLVLWQPARVWMKMKISSLGDVNEAYAAFYLNMVFNNFIFNQSGNIEWLIDTFLTHNEFGVAAVDNISGFFEGDVSINNVEYAIKSKGATSLSPRQVITLAENILSMTPDKLTLDYITNLKQEAHKKGVRRNVAEPLDIALQGTADDLIGTWGVGEYGARQSKKK